MTAGNIVGPTPIQMKTKVTPHTEDRVISEKQLEQDIKSCHQQTLSANSRLAVADVQGVFTHSKRCMNEHFLSVVRGGSSVVPSVSRVQQHAVN